MYNQTLKYKEVSMSCNLENFNITIGSVTFGVQPFIDNTSSLFSSVRDQSVIVSSEMMQHMTNMVILLQSSNLREGSVKLLGPPY